MLIQYFNGRILFLLSGKSICYLVRAHCKENLSKRKTPRKIRFKWELGGGQFRKGFTKIPPVQNAVTTNLCVRIEGAEKMHTF